MLNSLFFIVSKLVWFCISPDSLLLILLISATLLLFLKREKLAKKIYIIAATLVLLITLFPVGEWLAAPLEYRFETNPTLPTHVDGIIVLSGSEDAHRSHLWGQPEFNAGAERLTTFVTLARKYPNAKLVHSGGSGSLILQEFKEAEVAGKLYDNLGLDTTRILFEKESRNTFENVRNSKKLVNPQDGENWVVITTATHLVRSVGIFQKQGWEVIPYPVDHKGKKGKQFRVTYDLANNLYSLKSVLREWLGLVSYRVAGKTSSLLPK